jgi:iron complex outermembrane receptor protein
MLIITCILCIQANAEDVQLETIIVTSTKSETKLKSDCSNTTIITQKDIQKIHARDIMDLLRHVPGMTLNDTATGSYYVGFRGSAPAPKGTMIMVDGIEMNTAANYILAQHIPIENIERIEVIKNPASALYGSAGVGGVIHIITKPASNPFESQIRLSYGSYGRQKSIVHCKGFFNTGFFYELSGTSFYTDGFRDESTTRYLIISPRLGYETDNIRFSLIGTMKPSQGKQPGGLPLDQYQYQPQLATSPNSTGEGYATTWGATLDYQINHSSRLYVKTSYRTDDWHAEMDGNYLEGDDQWHWTGEINYQLDFENKMIKNSILFGLEYRKYHSTYLMHPDDYWADKTFWWQSSNDIDENISGIFLQNDFSISKQFHIRIGCRWDRIHMTYIDKMNHFANVENTHQKASPKIGFAYSPKQDITFFGNYSQGIRSVNLVETVWRPKNNLEPETIDHYELGIRGTSGSMLSFNLAGFWTQTNNYIIETGTGYTLSWENAGEVESKGFECSFSKNYSNGITFSIDYTFQHAEYKHYKTSTNNYSGQSIPLVPEHIFGAHFGVQNQSFGNINMAIRYVDDKYIDHANTLTLKDYAVVDLKYTCQMHMLKMIFAVNNLFDETFAEYGKMNGGTYVANQPVAYPVDGRSLIACLQWKF